MGYLWIKFGRKVIDRRKAESYKDTHLTWKLSDDIFMVLPSFLIVTVEFYC